MRRRLASAAILTLLAASAGAQEHGSLPSEVHAGVRVSATAPGLGTVSGRVLDVRGDTFVLASDEAYDTLRVPASRLTALDVSTSQHTRRLAATGIGLVSGMVAGAVLGAATYKKPDCAGLTLYCDLGRGFDATAGAVLLGGLGATVGLIIGSVEVDHWQPVSLSGRAQLDLLIPPEAHRLGVAASLRF